MMPVRERMGLHQAYYEVQKINDQQLHDVVGRADAVGGARLLDDMNKGEGDVKNWRKERWIKFGITPTWQVASQPWMSWMAAFATYSTPRPVPKPVYASRLISSNLYILSMHHTMHASIHFDARFHNEKISSEAPWNQNPAAASRSFDGAF